MKVTTAEILPIKRIKGAITLCYFAVITPFDLTNYAFNISSAMASATLIPSIPADKIPPA